MKQLALDLAAPPPPTLENFVAGRNAELLGTLRGLVLAEQGERCIYLWGTAGSGRSHLLQGAVAAARRNGLRADYRACAPGAALPQDAEQLECLALDDVDRLDARGQLAAFHLYNTLRERRAILLAAGGVPPVQLALREDLVTRLGWGLVFQVQPLSDEERALALAEHAATRGFRLPQEVSDFLLTRGRRDMGSLLATLAALDRYSLETKRPVTVPLARELLRAAEAGAATSASAPGARDPGTEEGE